MSSQKFVSETPQDREKRLAEKKPIAETLVAIDIKSYINVYEFSTVLPGNGQTVKFKPVTTGQMKKLLAYEQSDSPMEMEKALDSLIEECVISPDFDINKLYLQDRFFLLLQIRSKTKGDRYDFTWKCPICELDQPASAKISDMDIVSALNTTTVIDINDSLKAEFGFPTRGIQREAVAIAESLKGITEAERMFEIGVYTYALCMTTFTTPAGKVVPTLEDKYIVLNSEKSEVLSSIQKWMEENDFGVEFLQKVGCANPSCEFTHTMEIPYTNFFG
jgi:hypothetical protein